MSLEDTYEEVEDFMEKVEKTKYDIPDFDGRIWCEDYLLDIVNICQEWLEDNQEQYLKIRRAEEFQANSEYERSRI